MKTYIVKEYVSFQGWFIIRHTYYKTQAEGIAYQHPLITGKKTRVREEA